MIATVRVKPWSSDQGPFVIINKEDFDPKRHELYVDEATARAQSEEAARARAEEEQKAAEEAELVRQREELEEATARDARQHEDGTAGAPAQRADEPVGAPQSQQGEASTASDPLERAPNAATPAGADEQSAPVALDSSGTSPAQTLSVSKGPRGLFFVKAGDAIVSKGFSTEEEAATVMSELVAGSVAQ
jgi:hypothetical protein